jgi:tetratricopeptide (TPR) repeat protein
MTEVALINPTEEPFAERVNRLFRELQRAVQWDRPSILLAVYRSEFVRADVTSMLHERVQTIGQTVTPYQVTDDTNDDIPVHLVNHPDRASTIFFVSGLRWGGGLDRQNAYRALNIRREYLVDARIRAVFWLTDLEELVLPDYAPDFWAFRHRVVEFLEPPVIEQIQRTAPQVLWSDFSEQGLREYNAYKVALHESLLKDLRRYDELLVLRGTTLYTLARLRQAHGEHTRTLALLHDALAIGKQAEHARLQSDCYLARGTIHHMHGNFDEAIADFQQVVTLSPSNPAGYVSLSNVYQLSGRLDEAMALCLQALAQDANYASAYAGMGTTLRTLRLPAAAIEAYQQAIRLDPQDAAPCISLGNLYQEQQRYDEAIAAYQQAIARYPNDAHAYKELGDVFIALGHPDKAAVVYQQAARLEQAYPSRPIGQPPFDPYSPYEVGLDALLNQVDSSDPRYNDIVLLGKRLRENIQVARLSGDSEMSRTTRAEIVAHLNQLALATTDQSLNELCQVSTSQQPIRVRLSYYEDGLHELLKQLDRNNSQYGDALVYEQRLRENIAIARQMGDNHERQANRSEIIDRLNELAISEMGLSFNDLCRRVASEPVPPHQEDYASYERGTRELLDRLVDRLGTNHPRYQEALIYKQRLQENLAQSRRYGDSVALQRERAEIISQLNHLALDTLHLSFTALCGQEPSAAILPSGDRFAHYEDGLRKLQEMAVHLKEEDESQYDKANLDAMMFKQQLCENIALVQRYGDTSSRQRERATILGDLNDFARTRLGLNQSFFDLCRQANPESSHLDSDSPLAAQQLMLQEKRTVLEQAFAQHRETISVLQREKDTYETDPVRLVRIAQKLAEEDQQWIRTLLELEAVEESLREIATVSSGLLGVPG